jgi:hypothetical protein
MEGGWDAAPRAPRPCTTLRDAPPDSRPAPPPPAPHPPLPPAGLGAGVAAARAALAAAPLYDLAAETKAATVSINAYEAKHHSVAELVFTAEPFSDGASLVTQELRRIVGIVATIKTDARRSSTTTLYQVQRQQQFSAFGIVEPVQSFNYASYRIGAVIDKVGTQTLVGGSTRTVVVKYTVTGGSIASAAAAGGGAP